MEKGVVRFGDRRCRLFSFFFGEKTVSEGYIVHATLRRLDDHRRIDILKSFSGANTRLKLFEANIYKPEEFAGAIQARSIASLCIRSGTVRRLIYTASLVASSPLKEDVNGYKEFMDESWWTPLEFSNHYSVYLQEYTQSKTLAEKELLSFCNGKIEVAALTLGLVGGETLMPNAHGSLQAILSLLTNDELTYSLLKFLEELLARIPIVHVEDARDDIFCMKETNINGRFLCSNGYISIAEMASYYQNKYPQFSIKKERFECLKRETKWVSTRLTDRGFKYNYDRKMVLDDCVSYAKKKGNLGL